MVGKADARGPGAPKKRGRKRRLFGALGVLLAAGLVLFVPEWMLARGTRDGRVCTADYEAPRAALRPHCGDAIEWFVFPARVPWTASRARYRAEELNARIATLDYMDACVGTPDEAGRASAAEALGRAAAVVHEGSQRVAFDELGRSLGAPDPGRDADLLGDRSTLVKRGEDWLDWHVRLSTIRASLLLGDQKRTETIAKRYAEYDPRDQDLRTSIAALFCLGDEPSRGLDMLPLVQDDRASRRYEGMARNYGEVAALIVACAARAGKEAPAPSSNTHAGVADAEEAIAVLRLRLATKPAGTNGAPGEALRAAIGRAVGLLESGVRRPRVRVALLAAVLAASPDLDANAIVKFTKPHLGEEPFASSMALTATDWLAETRRQLGDSEVSPLVPSSTFIAAARLIAGLEAKGDLDDTTKAELVKARGAFWLEAAAAYGREGNVEGGLRAADEAIHALATDDVVARLLRSNVRFLCGDREHAYQELFEIDKVRPDATNASASGASALLQRAELALSLGKREDAVSSAERAQHSAKAAHEITLELRASWLLAVLSGAHAPVPSWDDINAGVAFTWLGFANPASSWLQFSAEDRSSLVDRTLSPFIALRAPLADAKLRRAARFALLREQGDAPPWLSTHLLLLGSMLDSTEGSTEVWLDAATALDFRRFSLRSYAFARAEAARMRGDTPAALRWEERYRFLRGLATDPSKMDLARHLDI